MYLSILNRHDASMYAWKEHSDKVAMISIRDVYDQDPINFARNRNNGIVAVCPVIFDDVEAGDPSCMTCFDAEKIASFVEYHKINVDGFIVHCEAGISRSAAIGAAIMYYLCNDDSYIFRNPRFCPNMHCYRVMLHGLMGESMPSEELIQQKESENIRLWRQANGLD